MAVRSEMAGTPSTSGLEVSLQNRHVLPSQVQCESSFNESWAMRTGARTLQWIVLGISAASLPACLAAAAAGAGGGIYFTGHTAEAIVEQSVDDLSERAQNVLRAESVEITESSSQESGAKQEFKGTKDDLDVSVTIERDEGSSTKVRVSARKNLVSWDDDYARELLAKIIGA